MKLISIFFALLSFSATAIAQSNPRFSVEVVNVLGGINLYVFAMNSNAEVVGGFNTPDNKLRAFVYSKGSVKNLGALGGETSLATGINDQGHIVGEITGRNVPGGYQPFLYIDGLKSDFVSYGINQSFPIAINNSGRVLFGDGLVFDTASGAKKSLGWSGRAYPSSLQMNNRGDIAGILSSGIEFGGIDSRSSILYISGIVQPVEASVLWSGINDAGHYVGLTRSNNGPVIANFGDGNVVLTSDQFPKSLPKINNRGHIAWDSIEGLKIYVKGREINVSALADLRRLYPGFDSDFFFNDADQIVLSNGKDQFLLITPLDDLDRFAPFLVDTNSKVAVGFLCFALLLVGCARIRVQRS
jgi:probable HAF family extracellular repeat protein